MGRVMVGFLLDGSMTVSMLHSVAIGSFNPDPAATAGGDDARSPPSPLAPV
jgi:hypothetical protein